MNRPMFSSLRFTSMMLIMGVGFLLFLMVSSVVFYIDFHRAQENLHNDLKTKSTYMAGILSSAIIDQKHENIASSVALASSDSTIIRVSVYDQKFNTIAQYNAPNTLPNNTHPDFTLTQNTRMFEDVIRAEMPIRSGDTHLGWLLIEQDKSSLKHELKRSLWLFLILFSAGVVMTIVLTSMLHHYTILPIVRLGNLIERVANTENYRVRVDAKRGDEIGKLISGFNSMLIVIRDREKRLKRDAEDLENLVRVRNEQLYQRANFDALTQLPNRYMLMETVQKSVQEALVHQQQLAILLIDLDRFKTINDSLGHHIGDQLLQELASRLRTFLDDNTVIARFGGDEFVFFLKNFESEAYIKEVANKILLAVAKPYFLESNMLHITASIGISTFPNDADSALELFKCSDISMYSSKAAGSGNYRFFSENMGFAKHRLQIENHLRQAIQQDELQLYYQPQVDMQTGKIHSVEALMRWNNNKLGPIAPNIFIPVAEEIGVIGDLTDWAFERAIKDLNALNQSGVNDCSMAINVSATSFIMADFADKVVELIKSHQANPKLIEVEITEDVFLDRGNSVLLQLQRLKNAGLRVAVDDFGTRYSSLRYLQDFPLDKIKLDGMFVKNVDHSLKSRGIVSAMVDLAHSLGLSIVAEQVETKQQWDFLKLQACDLVQGHYKFAAMSIDDLKAILIKQDHIEEVVVS